MAVATTAAHGVGSPAASRARDAARSVEPVVMTSSTRRMRWPASLAAARFESVNAPFMLAARWRRDI